MNNRPNIGQVALIQDMPWQITAIAMKWDTMDIVVVLGNTDNSSYVVAEYDMSGRTGIEYQNPTFYGDSEESYENWTQRAFGA